MEIYDTTLPPETLKLHLIKALITACYSTGLNNGG